MTEPGQERSSGVPVGGKRVVFCADGWDYGETGYIFFTHEADVMAIAAAGEVESGKLAPRGARELLEPYRGVLSPLYTGEQRAVFDPSRSGWNDPDTFPAPEDLQQSPPASQTFWYRAYDLGIDGLFLEMGGIGPTLSVESRDALGALQRAVSDEYRIVVKQDINDFDAMGKSVEWARRLVEEAR